MENLKNKLHDHLPVEGNDTLDDIAQSIIDQMTRDRNDFRERYGELEKVTDNLRTGNSDRFVLNLLFLSRMIDRVNQYHSTNGAAFYRNCR